MSWAHSKRLHERRRYAATWLAPNRDPPQPFNSLADTPRNELDAKLGPEGSGESLSAIPVHPREEGVTLEAPRHDRCQFADVVEDNLSNVQRCSALRQPIRRSYANYLCHLTRVRPTTPGAQPPRPRHDQREDSVGALRRGSDGCCAELCGDGARRASATAALIPCPRAERRPRRPCTSSRPGRIDSPASMPRRHPILPRRPALNSTR